MNRLRLYWNPAFLLLMACVNSAPQQEAGRPAASVEGPAAASEELSLEDAAATITAENVNSHITFLASDELQGRDTPSPGLEEAAKYVEAQYRELGLEPAGDDGTFIQRWPYHVQALDEEAVVLELSGPDGTALPTHGSDYFVFGSTTAPVTGTPVFAGTAQAAAQGLGDEVRDQIVVLYQPGTPSAIWNETLFSASAAAEEAGARGVIVVLDPEIEPGIVGAATRERTRPERDRTLGLEPQTPAFFVRYEPAKELFRAAGQDLDALRERANGAGQPPIPFSGANVRLEAPIRIHEEASPPNVVAVLPGSDPVLRDEYVVFSAHLDHVGVGAPNAQGDSIYNGADDNASGTSALLEAARAFAALPEPPARSIIFLHVSGEEKGLLGSHYFSERPTVPLEDVVTNINMDMVGRNSPDSIVAIGKEWSSLGPLLDEVAQNHPDLGLTVSPDLWPEERLFFRSDQYHFVRKEIPALFLFGGLHDDYHQPSDSVETVDTDKVARVARMSFYAGHEIASRPERPRWTEEGLAEVRALTANGR